MADADPNAKPDALTRPRGNALLLTPEQLDSMAKVDEGDAVAAEDLWKRNAPPAFKDLLDAPKDAENG